MINPPVNTKHKVRCALFVIMIFQTVISGNLAAQKYTLSPQSVDDAGFEYVKVIGQDENGFYLLQSNLSLNTERDRIGFRNRKYKIGYYDFKMNERWSKKLEDENENFGIDVVTMFNNHPFILRSQWQKSEYTILFSTEMLDANGNVFNKTQPGRFIYTKESDLEKARVVVSKDNTSACIILEELRNNDQVVHMLTLDTAGNKVNAYDPVINYSYKQLEITDAALSDHGEIAVLTQIEEKIPEERRKKMMSYKLFMLSGSNAFTEYPVSSGDKHLTEASLSMDNINKKTVITGFYNDNDSYTGTGIIFASYPFDGKSEPEIKTVNIDDNARVKLIGERNSGSNTGLYSYPIRKAVLRSDGGAVVIAEAAYYSEYSYYDYFTQSFTRRIEYHFDNVVIMSIHTNGTIDWSTVLRKTQESLDDGGVFSSFATVLQSSRIDLIYNKDLSRSNEVSLFTVDNKGISTQHSISRPEHNLIILPLSGKQVDENTMVVAAIQKKKLFLMKIEL
jgi:hypothetical protein